MTVSTQTVASAELADLLPDVQLQVRQGGTRAATYPLDGIDFLIGAVSGCDLRVAGEAPGVLCLFARHPAGLSVRKLAPTQTLTVNGEASSQCDLNDGDRVQIGTLEIQVRIAPVRATASAGPDLTRAKQDLQDTALQIREQLVLFQREKEAFERQKRQPPSPPDSHAWDEQKAELEQELQTRQSLLEDRALEIEEQQQELAKVRKEMADLRRQLYDHYQERRDRLSELQDDLDIKKRDLDEREKKVRLEEDDVAERRHRDRSRQEEIEKLSTEVAERTQRLEEERKLFEQRQRESLDDWSNKNADLENREGALAEQARALQAKAKQYEADVLRLNRLQGELEKREAESQKQLDDISRRCESLNKDSEDVETQALQLDELRTKLVEDAERLAKERVEHDERARELTERTASLEGQQATLSVLRGRLERMRDELRVQQQQCDELRAEQEKRDADLTRKTQELDQREMALTSEQLQYAADREKWTERNAVMDAAVKQLKTAQDDLLAQQERLRADTQGLEAARQQLAEMDSVWQGRLGQLAETQERLDGERQALRERGVNLMQREEACSQLQEQLQRRTEELAARHKEITDRLQEYQTKFADLGEREKQLLERDKLLHDEIETTRRDLAEKTEQILLRHAHVAGAADAHQDEVEVLAKQRADHAEERAQFARDQQAAMEKLAQARADLETLRKDAFGVIDQLPDAELRAGAAVERLSNAREQLRNHLSEIHQFVRQCQDELGELRGRLQAELEQLHTQEESLRKNQDEHRLAVTAFRQQLIDWNGQIEELKRVLARDETRLGRREAEVDERARAMEAESQRLAQQAVNLVEQEQEVADRREEMDRHLVDMREWYRKKLRDLAGIPLVPDLLKPEIEPTILPVSTQSPEATGPEPGGDDDPGIIPTGRSILSLSAGADAGDRQLGQTLRDAQLIDTDTLTALLAEARRQRRSLRQVLLASGVITLYQLALIEGGLVDGLMLGPVRVIDRLRSNAHETVYRVYDPRRGAEAVLRHLSEADMADAVKPDEFRQRFTQAMLNEVHLANTLEVLDLGGRPAAMQEWLTGLAATDWPPLAAAPGVCYRLLTQAAQGLAAAHKAGAIHGHLNDSLLLLTADGILKIGGLGEPPWLIGMQHDEEPTAAEDVRTLGKIVSGWCTPSGVRKGAKTKPLPDALVSILYRMASEGDAGYRDVTELQEDLEKAAGAIPANTEAWDRLLKYVREHGSADVMLRQSA